MYLLIIIVQYNHRCVAKLIELPCHVDTNMHVTDIKLDLTVVYQNRIPLLWGLLISWKNLIAPA